MPLLPPVTTATFPFRDTWLKYWGPRKYDLKHRHVDDLSCGSVRPLVQTSAVLMVLVGYDILGVAFYSKQLIFSINNILYAVCFLFYCKLHLHLHYITVN